MVTTEGVSNVNDDYNYTISEAWPKRLRRRFYDDSDRMIWGSTRTLVTLLLPFIKRFKMIISTWWLQTSSKFVWKEVKRQPESLERGKLQAGENDSSKIKTPSSIVQNENAIKMD